MFAFLSSRVGVRVGVAGSLQPDNSSGWDIRSLGRDWEWHEYVFLQTKFYRINAQKVLVFWDSPNGSKTVEISEVSCR